MGKEVSRIIEFLLAAALIFIFSSALRTDLQWLPGVMAVICSLFFLVGVGRQNRFQIYLPVIALGVLPILGTGALAMGLSAFACGRALNGIFRKEKAAKLDPIYCGLLVLLLLELGSALHGALIKTDWLVIETFLAEGAFGNLFSHLNQHQFFRSNALLSVSEWFLAILLFKDLNARDRDRDGSLLSAMLILSLFSASWAVLQLTSAFPYALINSSAFWIYAQRIPASFSDPNAFGLVAMILVPLLLEVGMRLNAAGRVVFVGSATFLLALSLFSGSRTEVVGLSLVVGVLLFVRASLKQRIILASALIVMIGLLFNPRVNNMLREHLPVPAASRMLKTISSEHIGEMLWSRQLYSRLAWEVFSDSPITGVGLKRFYELQVGAAKELGVDLQGWRDNANNYYLQVMAESGLVGIALVFMAFYLFSQGMLARSYRTPRVLLLVFPLVLLSGPHVNFLEVKILLLVLFLMLERGGKRPAWVLPLATVGSGLLIVGGLAAAPIRQTAGVYGVEHGERGDYVWTGRQARIAICSDADLTLEFNLQHPDISSAPVRINFTFAGRQKEVLSNQAGWQQFSLEPAESYPAMLQISLNRTWNPRRAKMSSDPRELGMMLVLPKSCKVGADE